MEMQSHPDIVLLMEEVRTILEGEINNSKKEISHKEHQLSEAEK